MWIILNGLVHKDMASGYRTCCYVITYGDYLSPSATDVLPLLHSSFAPLTTWTLGPGCKRGVLGGKAAKLPAPP